jgi:hypothetical protein
MNFSPVLVRVGMLLFLVAGMILVPCSNLYAQDDYDTVVVTQWAGEGEPMTYNEWLALVGLPTPIESELVDNYLPPPGRDAGKFCIIVNTTLYSSITASLDQYILDLTWEGYEVSLYTMSGGTPEELKAFIQARYGEGTAGFLLIGDLAVAWFEHDYWGHEEFPCDLFYMDMDGVWTDSDTDGKYDLHTGDVEPEVWMGRLTASTLIYGGADEVTLLQNYFAKNHQYRMGLTVLDDRGLMYVDDDWFGSSTTWANNMRLSYDSVVLVNDKYETTSDDYEDRLTHNYEFIQVCAHSSPTLHSFAVPGSHGGYTYYHEVISIDPVALFYNLFACSNARFIATNYMGGWYIFCDSYGLASVGSTKTGAMLRFEYFYGPFGSGGTIGEAFMDWFVEIASGGFTSSETAWHYGMTVCGDPTLLKDPIVTFPVTIWVDGTYGDDITGDGSAANPYQTISQGILMANTGDTVQVRPGVYVENIDFAGKGIVLNGFYGAEMTILKPAIPNQSTVKMVSGEPAGTQFSGFTFRDGGDCYPFLIENGAEPLVTDNIFMFNIRNVVGANKAVIKTVNSAPVFENNLFCRNSGISCIGIWSGTATIINNTFDDNARGFLTISPQGGIAKNNNVTNSWQYGIHGNFTELDYNNVWNNNPDYNLNNPGPHDISVDPLYIDAPRYRYHLEYNSPCINAGDPSMLDPDNTRIDIGALHAVYVLNPAASIQQALTIGMTELPLDILVYPGNYTENIDFGGRACRLMSVGGPETTTLGPDIPNEPTIKMINGEDQRTLLSGFEIIDGGDYYTFMINGGAFPLIRDNVFRYNIRDVPGQNKSVIRTDNSVPFFYKNLFYDNGGISCIAIYTGSGEIVNNTFDDNSRGFLTITGQGIAKNNIVTNSWEYGIHGNFTELDYNDVWNNNPNYNLNNPGPHDISVDPLYEDDYTLQANSPCINAGDPAPRYNDPDGTRNDMGAFSFVSFYVEVPTNYETIQAAIDGVPDEDATINVLPGVYRENIDFLGKTIRLIGAGNTDAGDTTFLEPYIADDPTVLINSGEGEGTELSGFTIREGGDTYTVTVGNGASPLIADNVFYDNIICGLPIEDEEDILSKKSRILSDVELQDPPTETDVLKGDIPGPPPGCGYNKVIIKCTAPSGTPVIRRNLFYRNGGISCIGIWTNAYAEIINNTFDDNPRGFLTISQYGGVALNNIVTNSDDYGIYGTWTELDYNDVWNNNPDYLSANPGPNNISADPLYVAPGSRDYYLQGGSPCIDAGHPDPQYNDPDGSRNDMGAFPYVAKSGFAKEAPALPATYSLSQNHPNPFNPSTRINFSLAVPCHVEISVYNVLGQRVRVLADKEMDAGHHSVGWHGKDSYGHAVASGIYFYRIRTDAFVESKKMLLLK